MVSSSESSSKLLWLLAEFLVIWGLRYRFFPAESEGEPSAVRGHHSSLPGGPSTGLLADYLTNTTVQTFKRSWRLSCYNQLRNNLPSCNNHRAAVPSPLSCPMTRSKADPAHAQGKEIIQKIGSFGVSSAFIHPKGLSFRELN